LLSSVLGPAAYLLPWIWGLLVWALLVRLRRFRSVEGMDRLAVCLAVVPLTFFAVVSCFRWVLPHWPLIGFTPLYPLLGAAWAGWAAADPRWSRRRLGWMLAAILIFATFIVVQGRFGVFRFPGKDPLNDMSGWESVAAELDARGLTAAPRTFVFTSSWHDSGQLAFSLRDRVPVLCYNAGGARGFAFWSKPDEWLGWDGLLVTTSDKPDDLRLVAAFFRRTELVAEFPMTRGGNPFRTVRVYRCVEQVHPFPFTYEKK
jgi:4-amino-4-deoxy-L-arabinose transferase-like glycosyltransferase